MSNSSDSPNASSADALSRAVGARKRPFTDDEWRSLAARRAGAVPNADSQSLLLSVDNFNGAPDPDTAAAWQAAGLDPPAPLNSYLRLGAVPEPLRSQLADYTTSARNGEQVDDSAFDPSTGEDLAVKVLEFADDTQRRCASTDEAAAEKPGAFPDYAQNYFTPKERSDTSAVLHTLGGWREHTEGNRIVTTRGDKVEVVGGNAKLVVLCRDPKGYSQAGWDASGGLTSGATGNRGATSRQREKMGADASDGQDGTAAVAWEKRSHGVWRSTESASKGDSTTLQHGDSIEESFGHEQKSVTGSEDANAWHRPEDCTTDPDGCKTNPKMRNRTWVTSMEQFTGSEKLPVPSVTNVTYVADMRTATHAEDMTTTMHANSMRSVTRAGTTRDVTDAATMNVSTTVDTVMTDVTVCKVTKNETVGTTLDLTMSNAVALTAGETENLTLGGTASAFVGASASVTIGARLSATIGATLDVMLGMKSTYSAGVDVNVTLLSRADVSAAVEDEVAAVKSYKALLLMLG